MYFNIIKISNKNSEFQRHARPSCNNCSLFLSRKNRVDEMASIHVIVPAEWDTCLFRRLAHCYNNWLLSFVLSEKKTATIKVRCSVQLFIYIEPLQSPFFFFMRYKTDLASFAFRDSQLRVELRES